MMHYDHIVVGAGSMGMAAGYFLAREGGETLILDAYNPPHDKGSHHGETRLIRFAYSEGIRYVPFALRAGKLWTELEEKVQRTLFKRTGVVNFSPTKDKNMENVIKSAEDFNLPLEQLTAEEANDRWRGFNIPSGYTICFEPNAGVLMTNEIIESYYELALQEGAVIKGDSRVVKINTAIGSIEVQLANGDTYTTDTLVLTVGAWAKGLLNDIGLALPLKPIRKTFAWYEVPESMYSESSFPGFAYTSAESIYYGFPSIDGVGVKVGRHDLGDEINPNNRKVPFGEIKGDQEDLDGFVHQFMPQVGELKEGKVCMYSMTPDEDFIIDTHPENPNIVIAAGFSGHGFKFSSAVGEALKDMILKRQTAVDLSAFSMKRFK